MNKKDFFEKVYACAVGTALAIPVSVMMAQAALESAWGESGLTVKANALFGIKANDSWKGKTYNAKTSEVYDNTIVSIKADFRAYDSWRESIQDHSDFLRSIKRYEKAVGCNDPIECCEQLQAAGYATDPYYASKLKQIIVNNSLRDYDKLWKQDVALETPPMPVAESEPDVIEILAFPGQTLNIRVRVLSNN